MLRKFLLGMTLSLASLRGLLLQAQAPQPAPATHVNADRSVTFQLVAPNAKRAEVRTDAQLKPLPMKQDDAGVWSVTTDPLPAGGYSYTFAVDGLRMLDPSNPAVRHNLVETSNDLYVPAAADGPPAPWEPTAIPHGALHRHLFTTHIARNLPGDQSAVVVYTPPGYDAHRKAGYPVLYLLHGWSDAEDGWTSVGRAHLMLDAMLAQGKIMPMIVVMPLGYGDYNFVTSGHGVWNDPAAIDHNTNLFADVLLQEIMPAVETEYAVAKGRDNHAIAGLSMGGLEALTVGLNHTDRFAYVVGMSSAIHQRHFNEHFGASDPAKANLKLLWVACGVDDSLIEPNREFAAWAKQRGLPITEVETPGAHTWLVWRQNLLTFAPLLFRHGAAR